MFKIIRRIIEVLVVLAIGAFGYWLWQHPEVLRPAAKLYKEGEAKVKEVLNAEVEQRKVIGEATGRATRIYTGDAFQLTDATGNAFNWRLSGIIAPAIPQQRTAAMQRTAGDVSREFLASLLLSNSVRVAILHQAGPQASDGIVFVGTNNVNLQMVSAGMAEFNARLGHVLPLDVRNMLERAELQARATRAGIWATDGLSPGRP